MWYWVSSKAQRDDFHPGLRESFKLDIQQESIQMNLHP
jgi:hypothetical protein